jgi:hypothetical protein
MKKKRKKEENREILFSSLGSSNSITPTSLLAESKKSNNMRMLHLFEHIQLLFEYLS